MKYSQANELIKRLHLIAHPEGGYYVQTHKSSSSVNVSPERYGDATRSAGTSIYYLLKSDDFSAWHSVKSDEVWNYHLGSSITIHMIDPTTRAYQTAIVGNPLTDEKASPQFTVKSDVWFAVTVNDPGSFNLSGCCVSPGFEYDDFGLAERDSLISLFPEHRDIITKYT